MPKMHVLFILVAASLLLFGCTGTDAIANGDASGTANASGAAMPNAPGASDGTPAGADGGIYNVPDNPSGTNNGAQVVPDLPPAVQPSTEGTAAPSTPPSGPRCSISLDNSTILEGRSAGITATASPGAGEAATFLCGSDVKALGMNGNFNHYSVCQFGKAGTYDVWVKIDGEVCASTKLIVNSAAPVEASSPPRCNLINDTIKKDYPALYFETGVNYSGFSPNSTLFWECGWTNFRKTIGTQAFGTDGTVSGIINVNCRYERAELMPDSIKIHVDGVPCGEIPLK